MSLIPRHLWTHRGNEVLVVRFVAKDGSSYAGVDRLNNEIAFKHPTGVGESVSAPDWIPDNSCGGGIHGWPWGFSLGEGSSPDWHATWLVYGVLPVDIIGGAGGLYGKCKFRTGIVRHVGTWHSAMLFVLNGQMGWVRQAASGAASAARWNEAASATDWSGAVSATGEHGAASATGVSGVASATGDGGAASATGVSGVASATSWSGAAIATGWSGVASATGASGAAIATGWRGAAIATGDGGAAIATDWSGAAIATSRRGAASATGKHGAAVTCGERSTVECGKDGIAVSTADEVTWIARPGAVFVHRYSRCLKIATFKGIKAVDGERITFKCGKIIQRVKP